MHPRHAAAAMLAALGLCLTGCGERAATQQAATSTAASGLPTLPPGAWDDTIDLPPDQAALVGPDTSWGWLSAEECAERDRLGTGTCTIQIRRDPGTGKCGLVYLPINTDEPSPRDLYVQRGCEGTGVID